MSMVRLRRLDADYRKLRDYVRRHPRVRLIDYAGDPPEQYHLEYRIRSVKQKDGDLVTIKSHKVEINLPRNYPRTAPQCRMLSPVFHPNIAPHAICVGDHWSAGETLQSIVIRIGEILSYQSYNVKSPLNGEAARWAEQNAAQLPLDTVSMLPEDPESDADPPSVASAKTNRRPAAAAGAGTPRRPAQSSAPSPPSTGETIRINCPECGKKYRIPADRSGTLTCPKCQTSFRVVLE